MYQNKLPADPSSLVLGIIALCSGVVLGCCGFSIVGLILSIIGLISANRSLQEFDLNPSSYLPNSKNNVNTAKVINIIALVLNGLITLFAVGYFILYGTLLLSMFNIFKDFDTDNVRKEQYNFDDENEIIQADTITRKDTIYNYQDSLSQE